MIATSQPKLSSLYTQSNADDVTDQPQQLELPFIDSLHVASTVLDNDSVIPERKEPGEEPESENRV